jgi:hypothetical protein
MAYTTPELAARDTHAVTDLVAVAIRVETFILFTAETLQELLNGGVQSRLILLRDRK